MDVKEEEDPLSDEVASQNEREFFTKNVTMKINNGAVLLHDDCDVGIKTEVKSETAFPNFCSQKEKECFTPYLQKQIKSETVTCSNYYEMNTKIETGSQKERKFLPADHVMKVNNYNSYHEMDNNIQIKEEPWWLVTETSSTYDNIKNGDFNPANSPRLYTQAVSGDSCGYSPLHSVEAFRKNTTFSYEKDGPEYENQESDVTIVPHVEKYVPSEQSGKCSDVGDICSSGLLIHKNERSQCNISDKSCNSSSLKRHNFICEGKKLHKCEICEKHFTRLSTLKLHNLIHEGKKPHKCEICEKRFIQLSTLKSHTLIHEGKKPHKCEICEKRFTQLSHLNLHNLMHEGKKPHSCKICGKSFTQLSNLKRHNLMHEGKKPHKCDICEKSFTQLSHLKSHSLIHEGIKPYKCNICEKGFSSSSYLKLHYLIHEGKKPQKCEICEQSFTHLSDLKRHKLIHEGNKRHKCETCEKKFFRLSNLKSHNLTHEGRKPCK